MIWGRTRVSTQSLGSDAESRAQRFLESHGLRTVDKNYRCRFGEIDLIMVDSNTLVFVEVRLRRHRAFGSAAESVTANKQSKVVLAAQHYLVSHRHSTPCRFDVVSYDGDLGADPMWIKNAFYAE